jgi:hypothetical protein
LAEHLERSANLPLTIVLHPYSTQIDDNIYLEAINILNMHSSRWHELQCFFPAPARHLHRLCGSLEGNILDKLVLGTLVQSTQRRGRNDAHDVATFSMKCKPSPTHLTLAQYHLANIDIVWNHLTSASLQHIGVDECFEFMRRAPILESLTLSRIIPSSGTFPIPTARIILPHLDRLVIRISSEMVVANILDSMCAPSLKHWNHQIRGDHSASHMVSFIEQSSFSLKTFKLKGSDYFYDLVRRVLYPLSSLEFLTLRFLLGDQFQLMSSFSRCVSPTSLQHSFPTSRSWNLIPNLQFHGNLYGEYSPHPIGDA